MAGTPSDSEVRRLANTSISEAQYRTIQAMAEERGSTFAATFDKMVQGWLEATFGDSKTEIASVEQVRSAPPSLMQVLDFCAVASPEQVESIQEALTARRKKAVEPTWWAVGAGVGAEVTIKSTGTKATVIRVTKNEQKVEIRSEHGTESIVPVRGLLITQPSSSDGKA